MAYGNKNLFFLFVKLEQIGAPWNILKNSLGIRSKPKRWNLLVWWRMLE